MAVHYDRRSLKLTWGGTAGGASGDIWQCGVHITHDTGGATAPGPELWDAGDLNELWVSTIAPWMSADQSCISVGAVLRWVKIASIDTDGTYLSDAVYINPGATAGAAAGYSGASPQDACVYSLWSGQSLGKGNYGRIYAPWCTAAVSPVTGVIDTAVQSGILNRAVLLLGGIQTYARSKESSTMLAIMHMQTALGAAQTKPVAEIKVGAVKDTQRRRRSALAEAYASAPLL